MAVIPPMPTEFSSWWTSSSLFGLIIAIISFMVSPTTFCLFGQFPLEVHIHVQLNREQPGGEGVQLGVVKPHPAGNHVHLFAEPPAQPGPAPAENVLAAQ